MQICIFEDDKYRDLEPLSLYRPNFELICGKNTLREKILKAYPGIKYSLHCRPYLAPLLDIQNPGIQINNILDDECLFINGRVLANSSLSEIVPLKADVDKLYLNGENLIGAKVSGRNLAEIKKHLNEPLSKSTFPNLPVENVEVESVQFIWDIIYRNGGELNLELKALSSKRKEKLSGKVFDGAHLIEKENIIIEEGAQVKPGAVIDASNGPVFIDKNSVVYPNAVIEGPVYIGESSLIKSCSTIYENVSIGKVCKVGGEVEDLIMLPYSNKQHSGFLGHAYLGSWVNIGADTNCSDLKNNYGSIKVELNERKIDTGLQFLGLIIGDHSKTAINTMFNTGTIAGFSSNIFGAGFPDKVIPSFAWGGSGNLTTYNVDKSIDTARVVMARRGKTLTAVEEEIFRFIFTATQKERIKRGITDR